MRWQECGIWSIIKMGLMLNKSCQVVSEITAIQADCQEEHSPSQKQLGLSVWHFKGK